MKENEFTIRITQCQQCDTWVEVDKHIIPKKDWPNLIEKAIKSHNHDANQGSFFRKNGTHVPPHHYVEEIDIEEIEDVLWQFES